MRGKDVIIVFVESYGQVAVRGTSFSPGIDAVLRQRTASLARAGWSTQSAWLTSPGFGGISQLAHSTLQSGLWVDSTQRYGELVASQRFTLSDAFDKAGWHTVSDDPADDPNWRPGTSFYHYDQIYNKDNVGYRGPTFNFPSTPDQYTLSKFQQLELAPGHKPVMAQIDLESSHIPWAPLASMVPWNKVGNGSIFDPQPARSETAPTVWRNANTVRQCFGRSIQYSMNVLTSWVTELNDPNLVLILLGDHQPDTLSAAPGPTTRCRSRSSPATLRCSGRLPPGTGRTGCCLARPLRSSQWTPSATSSSTPSARSRPKWRRPMDQQHPKPPR